MQNSNSTNANIPLLKIQSLNKDDSQNVEYQPNKYDYIPGSDEKVQMTTEFNKNTDSKDFGNMSSIIYDIDDIKNQEVSNEFEELDI